ncbi:hypothetical protein BCU85_05515 [Vibrio lentus]|uniref:hypothetical protein n=1 Tax=Vibrio lentus TaxID=136468 RepID=UPI000C81C53E|nr:hypothetical protein [Vibrio lentus]PMG71410.1 hypothetical protein BCU85_05515 [Vibrio lentus]PMM24203.1 hypothetical protein BCT57_09435 [Vibrio lentus]
MKSTDERTLVGYQSTKLLGGLALLQSSSSIEHLYGLLPNEHLMWEHLSASYERSVNKERLSKLVSYFQRGVVNNVPFDIPHIALVAYDNSREELLSSKFVALQYEKDSSVVVDGFLTISALSILLGRNDPLTGKQLGKSILNEEQKATLSSLDVRINIYYGQDTQTDIEAISRLFFDINAIDSKVYSQHIITHVQESPLNIGAKTLAKGLNLESLGGVSELNKITKSDSYVTNHSTLTSIILTCIAGKGARITKKLPTHLPNKAPITKQVVENGLSKVTPLMKGWLFSLENEFKKNSNGLHRSMQVWQALGVVAYELTLNDKLSDSELFSMGEELGQLDYDKSAAHWGNSKAFKKDSSGKGWVNATGGGRTFRDKVAEYFIAILRS